MTVTYTSYLQVDELLNLQKELSDGEKRLAKGGFGLNEAKDLAVRMKVIRDEIRDLISVRTSLDNHSAEGQAGAWKTDAACNRVRPPVSGT